MPAVGRPGVPPTCASAFGLVRPGASAAAAGTASGTPRLGRRLRLGSVPGGTVRAPAPAYPPVRLPTVHVLRRLHTQHRTAGAHRHQAAASRHAPTPGGDPGYGQFETRCDRVLSCPIWGASTRSELCTHLTLDLPPIHLPRRRSSASPARHGVLLLHGDQ
ncbi:hypothetical protein WOLCODRAFT_150968 [Wolfiporia cocos MD-104 SS10]|uniref:Uncharacterized protein n=1 Tax=Wolfiporia cocos (strain MD-104) TaxID=742152 RepID=A0A2H3JHB0_WOLCO|nr:hypothetical protein WOLCODRAFT_150968 [Wolfiporia cocos MD-104 SS10]